MGGNKSNKERGKSRNEGDVLNALAVIHRAIVRSSFMVFAAPYTK